MTHVVMFRFALSRDGAVFLELLGRGLACCWRQSWLYCRQQLLMGDDLARRRAEVNLGRSNHGRVRSAEELVMPFLVCFAGLLCRVLEEGLVHEGSGAP